MADPSVFLEAHVIYPALDPSFECMRHLVSQLSRTDALLWCARANLIVSNPFNKEENAQSYLIRSFFPEVADRTRVQHWLRENTSSNGTVFFRGQFVELCFWIAKWSADAGNDGWSFESPRARRLFGQAALVASTLWSTRVYQGFMEIPREDSNVLRLNAMPHARASLEENAGETMPLVALGRGSILWSKYMLDEWAGSASLFEAATGLSAENYFRCFASLATQHVDIRPENLTSDVASAGMFTAGLWASAPNVDEPFRRLLEQLTLPCGRLMQIARSDDYDVFLKDFRTKPILRTKDGRHIVLDPVHLAAQAVVGPLFALARATGNDGARANECFTHFGNAFERYVGDLVAARYPTSPTLITRVYNRVELRRGKRMLGDIDTVVVTGPNECCLIEAKAVFVPTIPVNNIAGYHEAVRKKYVAAAKPKGVGQLGRVVKFLSEGSLERLPDPLGTSTLLLPVLLGLDRNLDAPGHGAFLRAEFLQALEPDEDLGNGTFKKGRLSVLAPIVITIDDFEWLEASLSNFSLGDFLKDFSAADPERIGDVRGYALRSKYRHAMRNPIAAYEAAGRILDDLGRAPFGTDWDDRSPLKVSPSANK